VRVSTLHLEFAHRRSVACKESTGMGAELISTEGVIASVLICGCPDFVKRYEMAFSCLLYYKF
jgi:hypothetical protein